MALPGGHLEYGEPPEEAAKREAFEETGLQVRVVSCLGWQFSSKLEYPGPMLLFFYETEVIGGTLKGGTEGSVRVVRLDDLPVISPSRSGSRKALELFLAKREAH